MDLLKIRCQLTAHVNEQMTTWAPGKILLPLQLPNRLALVEITKHPPSPAIKLVLPRDRPKHHPMDHTIFLRFITHSKRVLHITNILMDVTACRSANSSTNNKCSVMEDRFSSLQT